MSRKQKRTWLMGTMAASIMAVSAGCFSPAHPPIPASEETELGGGPPQAATPAAPAPAAPASATPAAATPVAAAPVRVAPAAEARPLDDSLRQRAMHELISAASANDPTVRANALEALSDVAPDEAVDPAITGLTDPDTLVQFAACMAVGKLRVKEAKQQLLQMHSGKPDVVQVGVRFALHRLGDTQYSHDLEMYARDPDPEIRGKTALALGLLEEPSAVVVLRPMRKDTESSVRLQAAASLWRLESEYSLPETDGLDDLAAYAISKFPDDLILATLDLAAPKDQRVLQHVRANLTADYPEVCLAAARGCGELGSDEGYPIAIKGAHSGDARQRELAALALGAIGRTDAQPVLATLLKDSSAPVRVAAAEAILQLKEQQ